MYLLLEEVGSGASGTAHLAVRADVRTDQLFVVKRLRPEIAAQPEHLKRFSHEARIAVLVEHPNVVRVVDVALGADSPFLVMRYVEGPTLAMLIHALRSTKQPLSVPAAVGLARDALAGLHALHEARHPETEEPLGFVHRDLSPRNLIATREGRLCLIDLGLGHSRLGEWQTEAGRIMGSLGYMPPEQIRGDTVDHRADLWSIASVLFELVSLQPLVPGRGRERAVQTLQTKPRSLRSLRADVPAALDEVLMRALSTTPAARFESAVSFSRSLAETCPEDASGEVASRVEALFGDELEARARRLREAALTVVTPSPLAADYERIASRSGADDTKVFGVFDATQMRAAPMRADRPQALGPVAPSPAPAPQRRAPWATLALCLAVSSLAAVGYLWSQAPALPAPALLPPTPELRPRAMEVPSAVKSAPERAAAPTRVRRPTEAKTARRRVTRKTGAKTDGGAEAAASARVPPPRERVLRLSKRLQALRATHGEAAERLIMELTALDLVTDVERHARELRRIEREVAALNGT